MIDLLENRGLILGLALVVLSGCSATDTQPDQPADGTTTEDRTTDGSRDGGDSEAYGSGDVDGVSSEDMTAEEKKARNARKRAEQKAMEAQKTVYFDFDSSEIRREAQPVLEAHAAYMSRGDGVSVLLKGHTDERGSREYNMALGERRAESVARFLKVNGVDDDQVEAISYGEEKPAVDESNEEAWAKNRRVEIAYE